MRYAEYPPSPALASIVQCYWMLEGHGTGVPEPILPDGRAEIVLHYGVRFERHRADGRVEGQPDALLVGQLTAPMLIGHRGRAGVAAIRLRPGAVRSIAGCGAAELTDEAFELDAVCGPTGTLRERLALARSDAARVALLEAWLPSIVRARPAPDVDASVALIDRRRGAIDLTSIARHAGVGVRQLERRFVADVGVPPKTFARLVRLQHALARISSGEPLAAVAHACGYYDQSHMTRDFSRLAETSPAAWRENAGILTPLFVAR